MTFVFGGGFRLCVYLDFLKYSGYIFRGDLFRIKAAGIAQLVERNLAKVDVAGSSPVSRSRRFSESTSLGMAPQSTNFGMLLRSGAILSQHKVSTAPYPSG